MKIIFAEVGNCNRLLNLSPALNLVNERYLLTISVVALEVKPLPEVLTSPGSPGLSSSVTSFIQLFANAAVKAVEMPQIRESLLPMGETHLECQAFSAALHWTAGEEYPQMEDFLSLSLILCLSL